MFCTVQWRTKKICVSHCRITLWPHLLVFHSSGVYIERIAVLPLQMKRRSSHVQKPLAQDEHQKQPQKGSSNLIVQKR